MPKRLCTQLYKHQGAALVLQVSRGVSLLFFWVSLTGNLSSLWEFLNGHVCREDIIKLHVARYLKADSLKIFPSPQFQKQ